MCASALWKISSRNNLSTIKGNMMILAKSAYFEWNEIIVEIWNIIHTICWRLAMNKIPSVVSGLFAVLNKRTDYFTKFRTICIQIVLHYCWRIQYAHIWCLYVHERVLPEKWAKVYTLLKITCFSVYTYCMIMGISLHRRVSSGEFIPWFHPQTVLRKHVDSYVGTRRILW